MLTTQPVPSSSKFSTLYLSFPTSALRSSKFPTPPHPGSCFIFIKIPAYYSLRFVTPPHPGSCLIFLQILASLLIQILASSGTAEQGGRGNCINKHLKVAPRSLIILIQLLAYSSLRTSSSRFLPPHSSKILPLLYTNSCLLFAEVPYSFSSRFLPHLHQDSCLPFT